MDEIAPGLRRWSAWHHEWKEHVGSVAVDTRDGLVLIDPLDPPPEAREPDHVLLTVYWHGRTTRDLRAEHVWASARSTRPLRNRGVEVTNTIEAGDELPGGIRAFQTARMAEVVFWLPNQRALAVGDVLLGAGARPGRDPARLRLCPERWLGKASHDDLRESLRLLLELPVERVLVAHGEPVLLDGKRALAAVLGT